MTDEQLIAYLDAAQDRLSDRAEDEFEQTVEAVRIGTVLAHDQRAFTRWQRLRLRRTARYVRPDPAHELGRLMADFPAATSHEMEFRN